MAAATLTSALLAVLPAAPASAAAPALAAVQATKVEALLDHTAVGTLDTEQLVEALEGLLQLEGLGAGTLHEALTKTIEDLKAEGADLGELLESPTAVAQLEATLDQALEEQLGVPVAGLLETLLGGEPTSKLSEALGSVNPSELLGSILQSSAEPEKAISEALGSIPSSELEEALGSVPTGEFIKGTVEELASQAGVTPALLAAELGESTEQLPPSAMALTGTLANATKLGVVKTASGIGMAVLSPIEGTAGGATGPSGGTGGSGGSGGSAAATTVIGQLPGTSHAAHTSAATGRIRILGHRVHGRTLFVVVAAPSAGTVSLSANGVRTLRRHAARSGPLTLRTTLSRAALARHGHGRLRLTVRVTFVPRSGTRSFASAQAVLR